jgi:hypothetical protein
MSSVDPALLKPGLCANTERSFEAGRSPCLEPAKNVCAGCHLVQVCYIYAISKGFRAASTNALASVLQQSVPVGSLEEARGGLQIPVSKRNLEAVMESGSPPACIFRSRGSYSDDDCIWGQTLYVG